jgi:hypothetical protein
MLSSRMRRRVAFVRTGVLEELIDSVLNVARISELGATLAMLLLIFLAI